MFVESPRFCVAVIGCFLLGGCKKDSASSERPVIAAAPSSAPVVVAPPAVSASWYPAGTNQELKLTWAVYPSQGEASEAGPKRNLEIVARIGEAVKRVMLGPQFGTLAPSEQSVCNASLKSATDVSVIRFHTMGPKTFVARRTEPTVLEISWNVDADDSPEKTRGTSATIPIPADARIVDAIQDIRGQGNEAPFDCSASASGASAARRTYDWKDEVTLTGTVIERTVESARGGTIKTPFLVPDQPVDLRKGRPNSSETEIKGSRELWIGNILDADGKLTKAPYASFVGKKVTFRGHFEPSETGSHHSHPWIQGQLLLR